MDRLAKWMGLTPAVHNNGKIAYYTKEKGQFKLVCFLGQFNPRDTPMVYDLMITRILDGGGEVLVSGKPVKTAKFINKQATITLDNKVITAMGASYKNAVIRAMEKFLESWDK